MSDIIWCNFYFICFLSKYLFILIGGLHWFAHGADEPVSALDEGKLWKQIEKIGSFVFWWI